MAMHRRSARPTAPVWRGRLRAAAIAGLITALPVPALPADAQGGAAAVTCTNPVSGASWQIVIDYGKGSVDANPAEITPAKITWFDPKDGGNDTLDRKSGDFTAIIASSTGGYFRRAHCDLGGSQ